MLNYVYRTHGINAAIMPAHSLTHSDSHSLGRACVHLQRIKNLTKNFLAAV